MHINAITGSCCNNNYKTGKQPSFKKLIKDPSALPVINSMSKNERRELRKIEKKLAKTKFWDLKIFSMGKNPKEFKFEFIDKQKKHGVISDGIYPYNRRDNIIDMYSIIYGPYNISENVVSTLEYKSSSQAEKHYNAYLQNMEIIRHKNFNITPIESLKSKKIELDMLEEASEYKGMTKEKNYIIGNILIKDNVGNGL